MVLTPIEVAIEDVQKKICELDAAITQVTLTSGHVFAREQSSAPPNQWQTLRLSGHAV